MRKKQLLATLVMLSLMQGSAYAAITTKAYNDFFDYGRAHSYFQIKDGKVIKDTLADENDTVVDKDNIVTIDIYSQIKRDEINDRGTIFWLGTDGYLGKDFIVNFHEDVVFDGGDNDTGVGQSSFMVGGTDYKNGNVTINLDDKKTLYVKSSTVSYNDEQNFEINNANVVTINKGNLIVEDVYPNKPSDRAMAMVIREGSQLTVNNDSVKIYRSFNRDNSFWEDWEDSGLAVTDSVVNFTTKDFYIGSSDTEKYENFDYGINLQSASNTKIQNANNIDINANVYGIYSNGKSTLKLNGKNIDVTGEKRGIYLTGSSYAEFSGDKVTVTSNQDRAVSTTKSEVKFNANEITINGGQYGFSGSNQSKITNSANTLKISADYWAVYLAGNSTGDFSVANKTEVLSDIYNDASTFNLKSNLTDIFGQVYATNGATSTFDSYNSDGTGLAEISNANDVVVSADSDSKDNLSEINFKQAAIIKAQEDAVYNPDLKYSAVKADSNSKITFDKAYKIYGDIVASGGNDNDEGGKVIVNSLDNANADFKGDVLAGNSGEIEFTLNGANFEGRVDDYQDAGLKEATFNPDEFDESVKSQGTVNVTLNNSTWDVTGQSWVTSLKGDNSTIILNGDKTEGYVVHIGTLSGNNTFVLNLTPEALETSDMIYVQNGTNDKQTLLVANERELVDNKDWDEIRFATVADAVGSVGDSNFDYGGSFGDTYTIKGRGVRNVDYEIKYVAMDEDTTSGEDNKKYNGGKDFDEVKPGEDYVQDNYNKIDEGQNSQYIYLVRTENDTPVVNPDEDLTDSGKTVINMSRANYKNAIYMDRLNKRLGEARYINNEEEQGMWVRLRHDRIGQSGDFRSMNTMYELGYDEKQDCDNGERRVGFAVDYMRGSTTYSDILGKGETKRYGLWLYDTWMGDKGHYADYVAKWGHLSNDFDIRDKDSFERVTGDYSNNVFSVSAEYGRKKDIGNDWYIEPQAQLQLARVTGAEYTTTTQDTKVSVDGINSLIGRAGFRLGRDVDERSTVYVKADLLHEFLGDQTITATDVTGTLREEYENKGTWYDVGFGFATALSNNSYAFMDFEKSFGNDNDETYQINAGVQWTF